MKILSRLQKHPTLSHLPVAGILLDLALLCWAALLSITAPLIIANLRYLIPWVWIPQCLTLYAVVLGPDLPEEVNQGMALVRTILLMIGMGFLAVMGGVWVLISGMMLGVLSDSGTAMFNIIFSFFAAPAAFFIAIARRYKKKRAPVEQVIRFVVPVVFLILSETIMYAAAHTEEMGWIPVLMGIVFSYLPFRLILIFTPPRSFYEVFTAVIAFSYFIYRLL
jgi:hypothetical protein